VPGIVLSIAFILAFLRPLPVIGRPLYGTLGIIVLAYLAAFFSIALKPVTAAYAALDPALDEAARVSGAGFLLRMRRIFLPLVAPAAASGAILVFLTAYNEVTVSALLWSTGNETIGTTIFNYEDGGYTTLAAAMAASRSRRRRAWRRRRPCAAARTTTAPARPSSSASAAAASDDRHGAPRGRRRAAGRRAHPDLGAHDRGA
jgi:hypothetical protein